MTERIDDGIDQRFAVYGTLAPGQPNAHQLHALHGTWQEGTVRGRLIARGWAAASGYPGLELDPAGPTLPVHLLVSADLPDHWARLDEFEGHQYQRVPVLVTTSDGPSSAYIYALSARDKSGRAPL